VLAYRLPPFSMQMTSIRRAPNKRLKLTGALVLKEAVVSCPDGHRTSSTSGCADGAVARSLSAIR